MKPALTDNEGRLTRDYPDWQNRSVLDVGPGRWKMRNGHTAEIAYSRSFDAVRADDGRPTKFLVWFGKCETCGEGCSWNRNGTYASNGKHDFDIMGKV